MPLSGGSFGVHAFMRATQFICFPPLPSFTVWGVGLGPIAGGFFQEGHCCRDNERLHGGSPLLFHASPITRKTDAPSW